MGKGVKWAMGIFLAAAGIVMMVSAIDIPFLNVMPEAQVVEGSIAYLDLKAPVPKLQLNTEGKKVVDLAVDRVDTVVLLGNQVATLDDLARGQKVKVYYTTTKGKEVATSIVVRAPNVSFPPNEMRQ